MVQELVLVNFVILKERESHWSYLQKLLLQQSVTQVLPDMNLVISVGIGLIQVELL